MRVIPRPAKYVTIAPAGMQLVEKRQARLVAEHDRLAVDRQGSRSQARQSLADAGSTLPPSRRCHFKAQAAADLASLSAAESTKWIASADVPIRLQSPFSSASFHSFRTK
jgi:hypothetical protein